jgi:hypothetical protein
VGQALLVVASLLAALSMIPLVVQIAANGGAPIASAASYQQEALQAARAGLADYMNHAETYDNANYGSTSVSYAKYCSKTAFSSCTNDRDSSNPAFASGWNDSHWATLESGTSGTTTTYTYSYQYLVDTSSVSNSACPTPYTVYAFGRAGAGTHFVYQELRAYIQDIPGNPVVCPAPSSPASNCSTNLFSVTVPPGAAYAKFVLYGAQGGAATGGKSGGGGNGAQETAYVQVTPGQALTFIVGGAGADGDFDLLNLFANGGLGGCGVAGMSGGTGGGAAVGLLSGVGAGGGAASAVCWGQPTSSACEGNSAPSLCSSSPPSSSTTCMMAVAGGGGGQGGQNTAGNGNYGEGGYWCTSSCGNNANWTAAGEVGHPFSLLPPYVAGGAGGAAGGASGSSTTTKGSAGNYSVIGVDIGTGGGGGGGDCGNSCANNTGGGGGGGHPGGLLGITLGTGGGGGLGASTAMAASAGCSAAAVTPIQSYPVSGGTGGNGVIQYTFYGSSANCNGGAQKGAWSLLTEQVGLNANYTSYRPG